MIPKTCSNRMLCWLRDYADQERKPPSIEEIEQAANFRVKGALARCLLALREVAVLHLAHLSQTRGVSPETLVKEMQAAHGFDDGDGPMIVCTPAEALNVLRGAMK